MTQNARIGRNFLLADGTGTGAVALAAMRSTSFTVQGAAVDVTDKSSTGGFRELLGSAGVVSVSISARGLMSGSTQTQSLLTRTLNRSLDHYRLSFDNGDVLEGPFQIVQFEAAGNYNDEQTYQLALESAGSLSFTAI
jgi:TP901-1 family phage major tail protein